MNKNKKIAIIGAGMAGLNAARVLEDICPQGTELFLYDNNDRVGGRVRTDESNDHLFDLGFQVFLESYPEAKKAFDFTKLDLKYFSPGAFIKLNEKFHLVGDPFRQISSLIPTLLAPIGTIKDKLLILKLKSFSRQYYLNNYLADHERKSISTIEFLREFGFSEKIISNFFVPFFSGVFLERELSTPADFFLFLYHMFSNSKAALPTNGMEDLAKNLLSQLNKTKISLNAQAKIQDPNTVLINEDPHIFDAIIKAYSDDEDDQYHLVTTDYFHSSKIVIKDSTLYLNGSSEGLINHIAPLSNVAESYSAQGQLLSVNLLSPNHDVSIESVQSELSQWFLMGSFKHLKRYTIKKSLPKNPTYGKKQIHKDGLYYCGDHMQSPSINGALLSGKLAAEECCKNLFNQ